MSILTKLQDLRTKDEITQTADFNGEMWERLRQYLVANPIPWAAITASAPTPTHISTTGTARSIVFYDYI